MEIDKKNPLSNNSLIRIVINAKTIAISNIAANLIKINYNDGIMLTFNFKARKCSIFKENEADSFYFNDKYKHSLSMINDDLCYYFKKCYQLKNYGTYFFSVNEKNNKFVLKEVGMYDKISHVFLNPNCFEKTKAGGAF